MKLSSRSALAMLLGTALAGSLSSCDYSWTPGLDPQHSGSFSNPPGWRSVDVYRDSINYKQNAPLPGGVGSAAAIEQGSVQEQRNSAPAGRRSAPSSQTAGSTVAPVGTVENGNGGQNAKEQPKPQPR